MFCILKRDISTMEITDWLIATDCHDARRQAQSAGDQALAAALYRMEFTPHSRCDLPISGLIRYTILPG